MRRLLAVSMLVAVTGCAELDVNKPTNAVSTPQTYGQAAEKTAPLPAGAEARVRGIMAPLIAHMQHPIPMNQVHVTLMAESHINAANGGGGDFYVSSGLLQKANDEQLRGVLAHEIAHADLGHVDKIQTVGAGLGLGAAILGQLWPGAQAVAPVAGQLILTSYSRSEESAADTRGVAILCAAGYDGKRVMIDALSWLQSVEGSSGGGFLSTHPATTERIKALEQLPG